MHPPTSFVAHLRGGAFRTRDVELHGLTPGGLRSPGLVAPFSGVRTLDLHADSVYDRALSYEPLLGRGQVFCSLTAAVLLGLPVPRHLQTDSSLHVGAIDAQGPRRRGIIGHRLPADTSTVIAPCGLIVTDAASTWSLLAEKLNREDLTAAGDRIVSGFRMRHGGPRTEPLATIEQLRSAVSAHGSKRGASALRWAIVRVRTSVDSAPETLLRLLLVEAGYDEPVVSHPVTVDEGKRILHPDLAWPALKIAIEYEGDGHREDKRRFRADIRRHGVFEAAGWHVIRATGDDLASERDAFMTRVHDIVARRRAELGG